MYIPLQYKNENLTEVRDFLRNNAFGILVNQVNGKLWASHIPLELDTDPEGHDVLIGHVAKANPQWSSFDASEEVLCIFNGPHSYVSSSWYREEEVPTWNYIAVHVYGSLEILSASEVLTSLEKLVDKYERNSEKPIALSTLSDRTLRQVRGIVGFRIRIRDIHAASKLSQGRPEDHLRIIEELEKTGQSGALDTARSMRNNQSLKEQTDKQAAGTSELPE